MYSFRTDADSKPGILWHFSVEKWPHISRHSFCEYNFESYDTEQLFQILSAKDSLTVGVATPLSPVLNSTVA